MICLALAILALIVSIGSLTYNLRTLHYLRRTDNGRLRYPTRNDIMLPTNPLKYADDHPDTTHGKRF